MSGEDTALTTVPSNGIQAPAVKPSGLISYDSGENAVLLDTAKFEHCLRIAKLFANSSLVPEHYRGKLEDCFIAIVQATRMRTDVMFYMQNTYVVGGKLAMEGKLAVALINSRAPFRGPLRYEYDGDGPTRRCRAWAIDAETGERLDGTWVTWDMVEAERWNKPRGGMASKWMTIPEQMFAYRSAAFFGRMYCPDVLMGMITKEEADDLVASGQLQEVNDSRRRAADLSARILDAETAIQDAPKELAARRQPEITADVPRNPTSEPEKVEVGPQHKEPVRTDTGPRQTRRAPIPESVPEHENTTGSSRADSIADTISKMLVEVEQCAEFERQEDAERALHGIQTRYSKAASSWSAANQKRITSAFSEAFKTVEQAFAPKPTEDDEGPPEAQPSGDPPWDEGVDPESAEGQFLKGGPLPEGWRDSPEEAKPGKKPGDLFGASPLFK